jgi:serine/threonine-protein kinase
MHLSPADWPAVSALLDEALALPPGERDTFMQSLEGERAQYRETLRVLLAQSAGVETDEFLATLPKLTRAAGRGPLTELSAGDAIGPYRLLSELGAGGMGAVWLAERADGTLKRKVALKLPRLIWAKGLAERMARERDILSSLEHPNIARLYDAGVDQHGRPYLALEYVEGQPIDGYCRERGLAVKDRLQLLLQVCSAVAFAHSRLVVHRDLKPSNILVTADGQVRLLDFGIAKLMEGDSAKETQLTQLAGRALTLDYASPEQIKGEPIGTASDVYSLGVVAYELLTGAKPYKLKRGSAAELEEAIATLDAPMASAVTDLPHVAEALRGDLDAILNKALKKAPVERYPTIDAFAQDVSWHLNSEPVSAQPDAFTYRTGKFLRKYRVQVGAAAAAGVALALGVAVALWQAQEAQRQRDRAVEAAQVADANAQRADGEAQRALEQERIAADERLQAEQAAQRARIEAQRAEDAAQAARRAADAERRSAQRAREQSERAAAVQRYLVGIFSQSSARQADPKKAQAVTARELLDLGADRFDSSLLDQPAARQELAYTLSSLYGELAVPERSVPLAATATELAEKVYGRGSPEHMRALYRLIEETRNGRAAAELRPLIETAEQLVSQTGSRPSPGRVELLRVLATYHADGQTQRADRFARQAVTEARALGDDGLLYASLASMGRVAERRHDYVTAEALLSEAIERSHTVDGVDAFDLVIIRTTLAQAQAHLLRFPEAVATLRELLADVRHRLGETHVDALQVRYRLGALQASAGWPAEGIDDLEAVASTLGAQGAERELFLSVVLGDYGYALRDLGRLEESERTLRRAMELRDRLRPRSAVAAYLREELVATLTAAGRADEAERFLAEAMELRRSIDGLKPGVAAWDRLQILQAEMLRSRGRHDEAAEQLARVVAGSDADRDLNRAWFIANLQRVRSALDLGRDAAAAAGLQRIDAAAQKTALAGSAPDIERRYALQCGRLLMRAGDPAAAERRFAQVERSLGAAHDSSSPIRRDLAAARAEPAGSIGGAAMPRC